MQKQPVAPPPRPTSATETSTPFGTPTDEAISVSAPVCPIHQWAMGADRPVKRGQLVWECPDQKCDIQEPMTMDGGSAMTAMVAVDLTMDDS